MTVAAHKPTLVAPVNRDSFGADSYEVVARVTKGRKGGFFLAVPLSMLWKHSDFVANLIDNYGKPKIFFVQLDAPYNALLIKQRQQPWKALADRIFVYTRQDEVNRIMHAWGCDMAQETIATAFTEGDKLVVIDCTLRRLKLGFDQLKSLSVVCEDERSNFVIGEWGEHLYWPAYDLHVDIIDAIRYRTDKSYQKKKELESLKHFKEYGRAIEAVRKLHGFTRNDIESAVDISAKTVQRIEIGQAEVTVKTLTALAQAHKMDTNHYLNAVAGMVQKLR